MKYTFKKRARRALIHLYHAMGVDKMLMRGGYFDKRIDKAIAELGKDSKLSKDQLKADIKNCYCKYLTTPEEYFLYGFEGKDHAYRDAFLPDNYRIRMLIDTTGEKKFVEELTDKFNFYRLTKKYFGRGAFVIAKDEDTTPSQFAEFIKTHKSLFVKPLSASYGLGAHTIDINDADDVNTLYVKYINRGGGFLRIELSNARKWQCGMIPA